MGRLRGSKEEEREWRDVIKLGSKLGDREDIKRKKVKRTGDHSTCKE